MEQDYLLHKYLNGEASEQEIDLLKRSPEFADLVALADASKGFKLPAFDRDENYAKILAKRNKRIYRRPAWVRYTAQIAAVAVILIAGILFLRNSDTKIRTGLAEKQTIELPDGSEVRLNAESEVRYNEGKWNTQRDVVLSGEAYFNVKKGQKFNVITNNGTISVLGTQFNVFMRDSVLSVVCYEGLVAVERKGQTEKLPAGSSVRITNGQWGAITDISQTGPSWLQNESVFEDASLVAVLAELKRYYPITIELEASKMKQLRYTGSFPHDNLEVALRSICEPLKLNYEKQNKRLRIYAP